MPGPSNTTTNDALLLQDVDGSGSLDRVEIVDHVLAYVKHSRHNISSLEVCAVIDDVDRDLDFELDEEEFCQFCDM